MSSENLSHFSAIVAQFRELASIFDADDDGEERRARQILEEVCYFPISLCLKSGQSEVRCNFISCVQTEEHCSEYNWWLTVITLKSKKMYSRDIHATECSFQEGTAKSSPLRRPQLIQNCRRTKSDVNLAECQGTVPYLGTFLTDLAMIDQANPDYTEGYNYSNNMVFFALL